MSTTTTAPNASPSRRGYNPDFKMPPVVPPTPKERLLRKAISWGGIRARCAEAEHIKYVALYHDPRTQAKSIRRAEGGDERRVSMRNGDYDCTCEDAPRIRQMNRDLEAAGYSLRITCKHALMILEMESINSAAFDGLPIGPVTNEYGD